jgi:putative transposase
MTTLCVKIRLYPTPAQETALRDTLEVCRGVYNSFLHWRKFAYETAGKAPSERDQEKALTLWKESYPELKTVQAHVLQNVAVRVELAFRAFFRRVKAGETPGYPREKGAGCYDSFTFKQYGNGCHLHKNSLTLSKIGTLKAVVHRTLPGTYKTCTIRRQNDKWFACFSVEVQQEPLPESAEKIGIDVGVEKFAALSNGEFIDNPRFFRKDEKAVKKAQRKLAREKRGSQQRRKAKKVVSRIHERIANRRHDFVHQTARKIVDRFGFMAVEKLNVKNMSQSPKPKQDDATGEFLPGVPKSLWGGHAAKAGLNKSILDAAWSMFRSVLTSKAESAGRKLVEVNPAFTSQDCSGCGYRASKKLSERWHFCPKCGLSLDRDTNAAVNILHLGLKNTVGLHSVSG